MIAFGVKKSLSLLMSIKQKVRENHPIIPLVDFQH